MGVTLQTIESQVLPIEKAQKLIDLGVDTSYASLAYYAFYETLPKWYNDLRIRDDVLEKDPDVIPFIPTFTTHDLLMLLPPHFYDFPYEDKEKYVIYDLCIERLTGEWLIYYKCTKDMITPTFQGDLIDIVYEMLVWIIENKHYLKNENNSI